MGFRYREVEAALATALGVPSEELPAFRAKIRHLRNIGVPDLPKVGKGTQLDYTLDHAAETAIALEFAKVGMSPQTVADILKWATIEQILFSARIQKTQLVVTFSSEEGKNILGFCFCRLGSLDAIVSKPGVRRSVIINISETLLALETALKLSNMSADAA